MKIKWIILPVLMIVLNSCISYAPPTYPVIDEEKSYILITAFDQDKDATQQKSRTRYGNGIKLVMQKQNSLRETIIDFRYDSQPMMIAIQPGEWKITGYLLPCTGYTTNTIPLAVTETSGGSFNIDGHGIFYIGHFKGKNRVGNSNIMDNFRTKEIRIESDLEGILSQNKEMPFLPEGIKITDISRKEN